MKSLNILKINFLIRIHNLLNGCHQFCSTIGEVGDLAFSSDGKFVILKVPFGVDVVGLGYKTNNTLVDELKEINNNVIVIGGAQKTSCFSSNKRRF